MNDNPNDNTSDYINPLLHSVSSSISDASHFVPYQHQYNINHNSSNRYPNHTIYQQPNHTTYQQPNQFSHFSGHSQINPQIQSTQMIYNTHLAHNSMANQFGPANQYTTENISCPGCKLYDITCKEYKNGSCLYGHATKSEKKGEELFCDYGAKVEQGGGCKHSKCNRKHNFQGTNFHHVKCPRECAHSECYLNDGRCPYFHNGKIGQNGSEKWKKGQSSYGVPPSFININQHNDTDQKLNEDKSTQDLVCILIPKCQNGSICNNKYGHPNKSNSKQYYCQYDKACLYKDACFYNHDYKWSTDATPTEYICQFWAKGGQGCRSDANECRMYHPNGKKSKDY